MIHFTHLYQFKLIAELGSVSRAAELLYVAQPRLSKVIRLLEEEYNTRVFTRRGNRLVLTPSGELIYDYAKQVLSATDTLKKQLRQNDPAQSSVVRIASDTLPFSDYFIPRFIAGNPELTVHFSELTTPDSAAILKNGQVDVLFSGELLKKSDPERICSTLLCVDRLGVCVPEGSPYSKADRIPYAVLKGQQFIRYQDSKASPSRDDNYLDKMLQKHGISIDYALTSNSTAVLLNSFNGDYWGLCTRISFINARLSSYVFVPYDDENACYPIYMNYCRNHGVGAEQVIGWIRDNYSSIFMFNMEEIS